jgi:hypothetical protein
METTSAKTPNANKQNADSKDYQQQVRKPGVEEKRLEIFIGKWNGKGKNKEGAQILAGAPVTTTESYEWLPGGFFLVYRGDMKYGEEHLHSIRAIGFDTKKKLYTINAFDSMGFNRLYEGNVQGNVWKFNGAFERVTFDIASDGNSMNVKWEITPDGSKWLPLCEFDAVKEY